MNKISFKVAALVLLTGSLQAGAVLSPSNILAASVNSLPIPGKAPELCVIPVHFGEGKYGKKDMAKEGELCSYSVDNNVAACGKMNSTNPGVNFDFSESISLAELTRTNCAADEQDPNDVSKLAKYKLSTSCSYTPSLLAYYHVSRMLGNIANVPVAVLRTMDLDRHKAIAKRTMDAIADKSALIYKTWDGLNNILLAGQQSPKADLIFVEGYQQSYGALQRNVHHEEFYSDFFNKGKDRAVAFRDGNTIYKALTTKALSIGRDITADNVQRFVQLKDAGDMIVLDYILNQQDRFGNIHYKEYFYYPTVGKKDGKFKLKDAGDLADVPADQQATALHIKQMILKDNDCGISKENRAKVAGLLEPIAHMDPSTYRRVQKLAATIGGADIKDIFERGMQFSEADYRSVSQNVQEAAQKLKTACTNGKLALDLDIDTYFSKDPLPTSYSCD